MEEIICGVCAMPTSGPVRYGGGPWMCWSCDRRRIARILLADELATGRAAVRALDEMLRDGYCRMGRMAPCGRCDGCTVMDRATAVLATDMAQAWLEEGQDD